MQRPLGINVRVVGAPPDDSARAEDMRRSACRFVPCAGDGAWTAALDPFTDEYCLARGPHLEQLLASVSGYRFLLGACLREAPGDMDGVRFPSYYALTRVAAEAVMGVCAPEGVTHYSPYKPRRVSRNVARYVPLPRGRAQDPDNDDEEGAAAAVPGNRRGDGYADTDAHISDEATRALADIHAPPLNVQGRPLSSSEEAEVWPRNWFFFAGKPPHISQLAWNMVRPDARSHHLRWLARIKSMPTASLQMSLPAACIDLILSTARARRLKWATTAKAFAGVAGALRDLPLYSTQRRAIRLQDDPGWRSAFGTVQRYMKESVPVRAVLARLRGARPRATVFLAMMWGFAARTGDIATLWCKVVGWRWLSGGDAMKRHRL